MPNTHVEDWFEDLFFTVTESRELCNPAGREGTVPETPTHLNRYQLAAPKGTPRNMAKNVFVATEFGTYPLDLVVGDKLLVPTAKSLTQPPAPLQVVDVDHFKCYDVKLHKGTKFPKGVQITLTDQFYTVPRTLDVKGPSHLCPVARKNDEDVIDPCSALLCFDYKAAKGQAKFKALKNVYTNDQFGPLKQDTVDDDDVCVPARILVGDGGPCLPAVGQ